MAYKVIILYRLYMPPYFLGTFTEYPTLLMKKIGYETNEFHTRFFMRSEARCPSIIYLLLPRLPHPGQNQIPGRPDTPE